MKIGISSSFGFLPSHRLRVVPFFQDLNTKQEDDKAGRNGKGGSGKTYLAIKKAIKLFYALNG
jgi:hypothetical protein